MTVNEAGAATARAPLAPGPNRMDRWAQRSAGIPFRVKVGFVWLAVFGVLGFLFWAAQFDNPWIRDHIAFIARGLVWTLVLALGGVVLGLNYGAYMTEIFRAGIQSVSHGQSEAADALGMTYRQKMRRVVIPKAFRVVIPPTGNEFIAMMKDTALISVLGQSIGRMELFRRSQLLGNADVKYLEALISAAAIYWALTAIFSYFQTRLERRVSKGYIRAAGPRGRERGKVIVTGSVGAGRGGASGYVFDAPDTPGVGTGHPHAGGLDEPDVGVPTLPEPRDDRPEED